MHTQGCTHRILVFNQALVITTETDEEQYAGNVLETVNPLPPLALLAADINHQHLVFAQMEDGFCDTNRPCTRVHNVLFVWDVRRVEQTVQVSIEVDQAATATVQ